MIDFIEAKIVLLPSAVGGSDTPVEPRSGAFFARLRSVESGDPVLVRFIEGPSMIVPGGDEAIVLLEVASHAGREIQRHSEFHLLGNGDAMIGFGTILSVRPKRDPFVPDVA